MLKKGLLALFVVSSVIGGVVIKNSLVSHENSTNNNQLKEEVVNIREFAIPNSDVTNKSQKKTGSTNESASKNINDDKKADTKLTTTNGNKKSSVSSTRKSSNSNKQDSKANSNVDPEVNTQKAIEIPTTTSKTSSRTIHYDRTTSIYDDDKVTLLRVEYYLNNKLVYYSDVESFDIATKSYTEKIYQWNYEKDIEVLVRTDVYSNGKLIKSY